MEPFISIVGAAARTKYWMETYNSIGENKVPFEVIFVGPEEPKFVLPENFKFIKSMVKPSQCVEIASRSAKGNFLCHIGDDLIFKTKFPLDVLYKEYLSNENENAIISCKNMENGVDYSGMGYFFPWEKSSPIVPYSGIMRTELYREIGGTDRNFIAVMHDLDVAMRVYEIGGTVIRSNVFLEEDKHKCTVEGVGMWQEYGANFDRPLLESMWVLDKEKKILSTKRIKKFEPFEDNELLTKTQGPKGRW
mgnify:CR=1 FL=1